MFWRGWGCSGEGCPGGGGGVRVFWRGRVLHDLLSENYQIKELVPAV